MLSVADPLTLAPTKAPGRWWFNAIHPIPPDTTLVDYLFTNTMAAKIGVLYLFPTPFLALFVFVSPN